MDWTTTALNPDLFVTASQSLTERNFRFPPSLGDELAKIEGVDEVQRVRSHRIDLQGRAGDAGGRRGQVAGRPRAGGRRSKARPRCTSSPLQGKGVILSDNFARLQGLHYGDTIELATPTGVHNVPIVGLVVDWSDQSGAILMDRASYVRWWSDDTVNVFRVYVKKGVPPMDVRAAHHRALRGDAAAVRAHEQGSEVVDRRR